MKSKIISFIGIAVFSGGAFGIAGCGVGPTSSNIQTELTKTSGVTSPAASSSDEKSDPSKSKTAKPSKAPGNSSSDSQLAGDGASRVTKDENYIYIRTPWKEMTSEIRRQTVLEAVDLLESRLNILFGNSNRNYSDIISKSDAVDQLMTETKKESSLSDEGGIKKNDLIPSGILVFAGGKIDAELKVGAGGAILVGVVLVPTEVRTISLKTNKSTSYLELDYALVSMPSLKVGFGLGGGASLVVGAGLIWGDLYRAQEFVGVVGSVSHQMEFGVGIGTNLGVLYNAKSKKSFPFATVAAEFGASASAAVHAVGGAVVSVESLFELATGVTGAMAGTDYRLLK